MENTESEETGRRPIDVSWAAGYIDGEGCFLMGSTPVIVVESTCRTTIENLYKILGGRCQSVNRKTANGRPVFKWLASSAEALELCSILIPHLKDKKEQALLLSTIYDYPPRSAKRESIIRRLKNLKRVSL